MLDLIDVWPVGSLLSKASPCTGLGPPQRRARVSQQPAQLRVGPCARLGSRERAQQFQVVLVAKVRKHAFDDVLPELVCRMIHRHPPRRRQPELGGERSRQALGEAVERTDTYAVDAA